MEKTSAGIILLFSIGLSFASVFPENTFEEGGTMMLIYEYGTLQDGEASYDDDPSGYDVTVSGTVQTDYCITGNKPSLCNDDVFASLVQNNPQIKKSPETEINCYYFYSLVEDYGTICDMYCYKGRVYYTLYALVMGNETASLKEATAFSKAVAKEIENNPELMEGDVPENGTPDGDNGGTENDGNGAEENNSTTSGGIEDSGNANCALPAGLILFGLASFIRRK